MANVAGRGPGGGREEKFRREDRDQKAEEAQKAQKAKHQQIQIQKSMQHQPATTHQINAATSSWVVHGPKVVVRSLSSELAVFVGLPWQLATAVDNMTSGGVKSLMKGELYQATSSESWRVAISPSDDAISAITNDNSESNGRHILDEDRAFNNGDAISDCSTKSSQDSIDFLKDDKREMTFGRRIALSLINKRWYNPKAGLDPPDNFEMAIRRASTSSSKIDDFDAMMSNTHPNLEKSWAYFEHVALYRYLVPQEERDGKGKSMFARVWSVLSGKTKLERAEPGENEDPTRLYHPLMTPHSQLG